MLLGHAGTAATALFYAPEHGWPAVAVSAAIAYALTLRAK